MKMVVVALTVSVFVTVAVVALVTVAVIVAPLAVTVSVTVAPLAITVSVIVAVDARQEVDETVVGTTGVVVVLRFVLVELEDALAVELELELDGNTKIGPQSVAFIALSCNVMAAPA